MSGSDGNPEGMRPTGTGHDDANAMTSAESAESADADTGAGRGTGGDTEPSAGERPAQAPEPDRSTSEEPDVTPAAPSVPADESAMANTAHADEARAVDADPEPDIERADVDTAGEREIPADPPAGASHAQEPNAPESSPPQAKAADSTPADSRTAADGPPAMTSAAGHPRRLRRAARRAGLVLLGLAGLGVLGLVVAYLLTPIPSAQSAAKAEGSVFYYADGKTVIAKQGTNRVVVPLRQVPLQVRMALISAENRSFYDDSGVSITGTTRALWSTISGAQVQGGSTITQQMVRNYYSGLSQERTVFRKLKEIMVSLKVGREKNKDWILEQYLNTIYFGRNAYGIQAAAKAYYNTDVGKLTPEQGAYLAAAIQMPSYFAEPYGEKRAPAEQRWRYVIDGMVRLGAIKASDAATMAFPIPPQQKHTDVLKGQIGYMLDAAKAELQSHGYAEDEINRGGLKVITTFEKRLMDAAARAVKTNTPPGTSKKVLTGLVSVNPANGEVQAFYGGRDYLERQLNSSFDAYAQAGSGFKPYVLAAALADGESLNTVVDGSSPQIFNGTAIHNNGNASYGMVNLVTATQLSINTAYINLGGKIGLNRVVAMAEKLGIPRKQLTANQADTSPTLPLGTVSVSPVQQAGAFATFAGGGVYHKPHVIKSIARPGGRPQPVTEPGARVLDKQVADDAAYAMTKVVEGGTGTGAQLYDRQVAGKTGTTDKGRAIWFNGFIPQMATSVGIFRTDNKPLQIPGYSIYGGVLPAQIWRTYMIEATRGMAVKSFGRPSIVTGVPHTTEPTPAPPKSQLPAPTIEPAPPAPVERPAPPAPIPSESSAPMPTPEPLWPNEMETQ